MGCQYKLIVSNRNFYREFEILDEMERIKIGTTSLCEFRINSDFFFEHIEIQLEKEQDCWIAKCQDNLYISRGDVRKLLNVQLEHGDSFSVCYSNTGEMAFEMRFLIDFEAEIPTYNWKVDLSQKKNWRISDSKNADFQFKSIYGENSDIEIVRAENEYFIYEKSSKFGVYKNGKKIEKKERLRDYDFVSIADFIFFYKEGSIYFDIKNITVNNAKVEVINQKKSSLNYPLFNRSTRLKYVLSNEDISILVPTQAPKKPQQNIAMTLLPALVMLALTVVVRGFMSNSSNNTFIIFSVCSMSMGIITSIASFVGTRKKYKTECNERIEQYTKYIERKKRDIELIRQEEQETLEAIYYNIEQDVDTINEFGTELFDRVPGDDDFLKVYVGKGRVESQRQVDYKKQETFESNDELDDLPMEVTETYKYIEAGPITLDLLKCNAVGIVGKTEVNYNFMKNIIIDLVARHYYGDLKLVMLLEDDITKYEWTKYLPHITNAVGTRNLVYDSETKNNVFEQLYKELTWRSERKTCSGLEYIVVIVMDERGLKNHPLSQFIEKASELHVTFIFFEKYAEQIPLFCEQLIVLQQDGIGNICDVMDSGKRTQFSYTTVSDEIMLKTCEMLSPVYCEEISLESSLRRNISLFELLHIYSVEDINLRQRWDESQIYNSMAAPLGVNSKDETVYLNLHEKAHGPHGLVAGTTGSGKSEILQTFILSAATLFHPYELSFVIIDFKGGGMVNQFKDLPHLIGAITNIDGREIDRSLKSIKAELLKRQTVFAEVNVNHIDKYIKLYKEGKATIALPHLIIIVDEFAELKAEQPEFMKELISAARIGRSLGVHLILATQKPSGQVNEQIWSNSKFKLCLKVQNKEDSNEVLKSPLAAEIREPGRAYLQVGNNEIFELLQSGYSGAPEKNDGGREKEFVISEVEFSGKRKNIFTKKAVHKEKNSRSQLEAVVQYIKDYCNNNDILKLSSICLPPLKESIEILTSTKTVDMKSIPIGIYDDPDSQYQGEARFNFCEENTMIIGSAATGKTNLLQTIIRQIASNFSPEEANIYILDFGAMYLKNFEQLNHVGGIVTISDEEKLRNLFKLILEEIQNRKARFLEVGISSFSAYVDAGYRDCPQIFLMIDNFTAFKEVYGGRYEEDFIYITREGLACGISVIIANSQTSGLGYKYMSNFACRIAFHCNDSSEYSALFDRCRIQPKDVPGRVLCKINKMIYEMQTYLAFEGEKEIDRSRRIKEFVDASNERNKGMRARSIPEIPEILHYSYIENNYNYKKEKYKYPIALDYATVDVVSLDFNRVNEFCIVGNELDKRMNGLGAILKSIEENALYETVKLYIIDNFQRSLKHKSDTAYVEKYTIDYSYVGELLTEIEEEFAKRYDILVNEGLDAIAKLPLYLVVVNNKEAVDYISTTKSVLEVYNKIMKQYKSLGVCFIYSDIEDSPIPYSAPELMKRFKENKKVMFTTKSLQEVKFCEVPSTVARNMKSLGNGDVYLLNGTEVQRVKVLDVK